MAELGRGHPLYRHAITGAIDGFMNVTYHGSRGGVQDTVTLAAPAIAVDPQDIWGLRTGFDYKTFEAALFVTNLTNETVQLLKATTNGIVTNARFNQPRTFGLNVTYHW